LRLLPRSFYLGNISFFSELVRKGRINVYSSKMTDRNSHSRSERYGGFIEPCLGLIEKVPEKVEKEDTVGFTVKVQASAKGASADKYKLFLRRFDEGGPAEFITLMKGLKEIWRQNSITDATDQVATIRTVIRNESMSAFEAAAQEARETVDGDVDKVEAPLDGTHVVAGLAGIARVTFPYRALEIQTAWLRRSVRKPKKLKMRPFASAVVRINNSIPYFPGGTDTNKLSEAELLEVLEYAIPGPWRSKFDLEGYIPRNIIRPN
jgi:hypothetical protein